MKRFALVACVLTCLATGNVQSFAADKSPAAAHKSPAAGVSAGSRWLQDESSQDRSLALFLQHLRNVVAQHDTKQLLAMVPPHVKASFGIDHGKSTFIQMWHLNDHPEKSDIWRQLHDLLGLGGSFTSKDHSSYVLPYLFMHFPVGYAPEMYALVVGSNVNVHARPDVHSRTIANLSYAVVRPTSGPEGKPVTIDGYNYQFIGVTTTSGVHGYICEKYVRSPYGYRLGLSKTHGKWQFQYFVTGD
ncbi:MAG: hypothetical protein K6T83_01910 [Alicyclobacillus sp.]|nr:hypothetical protein [Alicyclobacillus sp.]